MYIEEKKSKELMTNNMKVICQRQQRIKQNGVRGKIAQGFNEIVSTLKETGVKRTIFKIKCRINKSLIFDKNNSLTDEKNNEMNYKYSKDFGNDRVAVYTAIYGGYDNLLEPLYVSPLCDYYVFSDFQPSSTSVWKKVDPEEFNIPKSLDNYHLSKYIKFFPEKFFPGYKYSIWVDGATQIVADLAAFADRLNDKSIGMFDNPVHDCVYTEGNFLIYYNRVKEKEIKKQLKSYKSEGFPKHFGMFECTVIVRKHGDALCQKLMEQWWEQVNQYTMRDQISFPYVLWKNKLSISDIFCLGSSRFFNPRISFEPHIKTIRFSK